MKLFIFFTLMFGSNLVFAGKPSAQPIFKLNDVRIASPYKVEFSIKQSNGSEFVDKGRPIVKNIYVEVLSKSTSSTKGRDSSLVLASIRHYLYTFTDIQNWMSHRYLDDGASHQNVVSLGKSLTLESSDLAGKNISLQIVEEYESGKKVVASSLDLSMPVFSGDISAPEIDPDVDALRGFINAGTSANGYSIITRPGTFVKDNIGVKYVEIYINGILSGVSSYSQQAPNQTYTLGDAELNSRYHIYETEVGASYYFQYLPVFFISSPTTILLKAYDFAGNVGEKIINLGQ